MASARGSLIIQIPQGPVVEMLAHEAFRGRADIRAFQGDGFDVVQSLVGNGVQQFLLHPFGGGGVLAPEQIEQIPSR